MTSMRSKHIEASSRNQQGGEHSKAPCSSQLQSEKSSSAAMEQLTLDIVSEDLMEQIVDPENFETAWAKVRANRGDPGPDGITLDEFPELFRPQWAEIRQQLLEGTYRPGAARRKSIPKGDGSQRDLGIPNVMDRLIQQAILLVLTPISRKAAERVFDSVGRYLTLKLKLVVNQQKSRICSTHGVEFLGFAFRGFGGSIRVSPKNIAKFKDRVKEITRRTRGVSMTSRLQELKRHFNGWVAYFRSVPIKSTFSDLVTAAKGRC